MHRFVGFLALLINTPCGCSVFHGCIPNSQFERNGKICECDNAGRWYEQNCRTAEHRQLCRPGQVILTNCSRCICQENGQFLCTKIPCTNSFTSRKTTFQFNHLQSSGTWCTPFRTYYINCTLCTCPPSAKTSEATCIYDKSCIYKSPMEVSRILRSKNVCIPKVMYLFPCHRCLCSDYGYFEVGKCVENCQKQIESRRCTPDTFYRKDCNICRCPESGAQNESLCSKNLCTDIVKFESLNYLRSIIKKCSPNSFTNPICLYCSCDTEGGVNLNACFESECLVVPDFKYDFSKLTCNPDEILPICMQCYCPENEFTDAKYCTSTCSDQNKLIILDKVLLDSKGQNDLINWNAIKQSNGHICSPGSIFIDQGRLCLCPDNGSINFKLCTSSEDVGLRANENRIYNIKIDFNTTCEAGTFVDFDCNTCYCMKNGRLDPKWCTYDDCYIKKIIKDNHNINHSTDEDDKADKTCVPGAMLKVDCNFCICPDSGLIKECVCTRNVCDEFRGQSPFRNDKLICEPLTYYSVDCNICFCPRNGFKNIDKCTKNHCEKNYLRSSSCVPGDLLSENCNICVCPPNGDKSGKVCTNRTCSEVDTQWQNIFKITQNLLKNKVEGEVIKNLDLCFPGEEFTVGCKICVCPDMGLREYASCTPMLCNEDNVIRNFENSTLYIKKTTMASRRVNKEGCLTYNLTDSSDRKECTPGSMYIIRCRQCICPYMGNINYFCRPLPKGFYCEQAYPNFNYLPMGRRNNQGNYTVNFTQSTSMHKYPSQLKPVTVNHNHTKYKCEKPGKITDDCFICDCEENVLIEEHCFKSEDVKCKDQVPTFLWSRNKIVS